MRSQLYGVIPQDRATRVFTQTVNIDGGLILIEVKLGDNKLSQFYHSKIPWRYLRVGHLF